MLNYHAFRDLGYVTLLSGELPGESEIHNYMDVRPIRLSRALFAFASAGLAVFNLAFGNFAPGQPMPNWLPARELWIHGTAFVVLAASFGLCVQRSAMVSVGVIGVYVAAWALLSMQPIVQGPLHIGAWYGLSEAMTCLAGAVILVATLRRDRASPAPRYLQGAAWGARMVFAFTCVFYGVSHFAYAQYTASMVPAWLPAPVALAHLTGVAHVTAGIAIATGVLSLLAARLEALMMMLFGLLVWVPTFWANPRPVWANPPATQWSELAVTAILAAAAYVVAGSLERREPADSTGHESAIH